MHIEVQTGRLQDNERYQNSISMNSKSEITVHYALNTENVQ